MKRTKELKTNKGITLIALIITIIVMLILVGVTISMAVNGGLFNYAGKAVGETKNAINAEQDLANGGIKIDNTYYNSIDEYLNKDSGPVVCPCCNGTGDVPVVYDEDGIPGVTLMCPDCSYVVALNSPYDTTIWEGSGFYCDDCYEGWSWYGEDTNNQFCPYCESSNIGVMVELGRIEFPCGHVYHDHDGMGDNFIYEGETCPYCDNGYINK